MRIFYFPDIDNEKDDLYLKELQQYVQEDQITVVDYQKHLNQFTDERSMFKVIENEFRQSYVDEGYDLYDTTFIGHGYGSRIATDLRLNCQMIVTIDPMFESDLLEKMFSGNIEDYVQLSMKTPIVSYLSKEYANSHNRLLLRKKYESGQYIGTCMVEGRNYYDRPVTLSFFCNFINSLKYRVN